MTNAVASTEQARCGSCRELKPLSEFRRVRRGQQRRRPECRACHNKSVREHSRRRRYKELCNTLLPLARKSARAGMTEWAVGHLVAAYGGVEGFVDAWRDAIDFARQQGETLLPLRSYQLVLEVLSKHHERLESVEFDTMSEAELKDFILGHLADRLCEHPSIIVAAARAQGWKVKAPSRGGQGDARA